MKKLNQKGFTLVEGLLILIALSLVVGVGFYVVNANKKDKDSKNTSQTIPDQKIEKKLVENNKTYLEIKELGVKFELTDKIKNAYYGKINNYYYLSVRDFDSNPTLTSCGVDNVKDTTGILALVTGRPGEDNGTPAGGVWTVSDLEQSGLKKVGDTYYGFVSGNGPCFDSSSPNSQELASTVASYKKAFSDQGSTFTAL